MARPNKILNSPHLKKIVTWIKDGKGDTEIITLLKKQDPPETIGRTTLYNFRKSDFDIETLARKEYVEKELDDAVKKRVAEIGTLDQIIELADTVNLNINSISPNPLDNISQVDIEKLKIKVLELVIKAVNAKREFVKVDDPNQINLINVDGNVTIADKVTDPRDRASLTRIAAKYSEGEGESES